MDWLHLREFSTAGDRSGSEYGHTVSGSTVWCTAVGHNQDNQGISGSENTSETGYSWSERADQALDW